MVMLDCLEILTEHGADPNSRLESIGAKP